MGKRCFDLIDLPCLTDIDVVAGKEGLKNSIFWVHIAEAATDVDNLFDWLKPDDFLIIIGNFLKENKDVLYEITKRAADIKLSGILLYKSEYCTAPPQYMIDICNENSIPVFFLKDISVSAIEIQYYIERMIVHDDDNSLPDKIIKDIFYGAVENTELKVKRASFMGYDLDRCHCGITIELYDKVTHDEYKFERNLRHVCYTPIKEYTEGNALYFHYGNKLISLLPRIPQNNLKIKSLCGRIKDDLLQSDKNIDVIIGIGQGKNDVKLFKQSIDESLEITRVMRMQQSFNQIKSYCDMYAHILIYQMRNNHIAQDLCDRLFTPLNKYDQTHNNNLKEVLKIYLEEDKNISQTSKRLYIHRNTLLYQIKKIEELTSLSLSNPENDFQLRLAFYLDELITSEKSEKLCD